MQSLQIFSLVFIQIRTVHGNIQDSNVQSNSLLEHDRSDSPGCVCHSYHIRCHRQRLSSFRGDFQAANEKHNKHSYSCKLCT